MKKKKKEYTYKPGDLFKLESLLNKDRDYLVLLASIDPSPIGFFGERKLISLLYISETDRKTNFTRSVGKYYSYYESYFQKLLDDGRLHRF